MIKTRCAAFLKQFIYRQYRQCCGVFCMSSKFELDFLRMLPWQHSPINHNIDCPHCKFYIRVRSFLALSLCNCHSIYPVFFHFDRSTCSKRFLFLRKLTALIPVLNHSKSIYIHCLS